MLYRAEPIYEGRVVAVVGGGPSLSLPQVRMLGMARARGLIRVITLNDAVYPCWFSDIAYACDAKWWRHHCGVPGFEGMRLSLEENDHADRMVITGTTGFDPDPGALRTGGNSGYQALHLCAHLMPRRVILVGIDMAGTHWFGDHPPELWTRTPDMQNRIRRFDDLKGPLAERGIEVVNASPNSALPTFPRGDLATELQRLEPKLGTDRQMVAGRNYGTR